MLTTLAILEVVYLLILSVWIVMEKRPPAATIAWIVVLAALPLVGFVVYYLLGPRRMKRTRSRRTRAFSRLRASLPDTRLIDEATLALTQQPRIRQMMALALNNSAAQLTGGNRIVVLKNGGEKFPALEKAIERAEHHVHLLYYIYRPDETGTRLRELLVRKAKEGVKVRLLVDAVGSSSLSRKFLAPMKQAGIEIAFFHPMSIPLARAALNFRNHRKIVIVDGHTGFTGGLNIGDEYAGGDGSSPVFRDTHLMLEGPSVRGLQRIFFEDWHYATDIKVNDSRCFDAPVRGDQLVQVIQSGPDQSWQAIHQVYFNAITSAKERVLLTTPYFVPDESLVTALTTASMRGVDVKLLLPRRSDNRLVLRAGRSFYEQLLDAGVRIYEYKSTMLHAKTLSVDGVFGIVGTANMDPRSFGLNWEIVAASYGEQLAGELEVLFEQDLSVSGEVTRESRMELPWHERFFEAGARVFSPLL